MDPSVAPTAADIERAAQLLDGIARKTPLERNRRLSDATGARVWLKREDLQAVRSYKIRGAFTFISLLPEAERARGVVCASAGNHAQGVASACRRLGAKGRVYVPSTTPRQKRQRIAAFGQGLIEIVVTGDSYDEANAAAQADAEATGATIVPAFDDPTTIAGQGTVAPELVAQLGFAPDVLIVPVGGGGLIAGIMTWMRRNCRQTRIVGVEPEGAASVAAALEAGRPVRLAELDSFVDGAAVRQAGAVPLQVISRGPHELTAIDDGRVCTEMLELYQQDGVIAEPAGALASAALASGVVTVHPGQSVVCMVSGGNNDVSRYGEIVERSLISQGLRHYFLVTFPQEPGALRRFLDTVLGPDDDITRFEYTKRNNRETGPAMLGIEIPRADDLPQLLARLEASPLEFQRIEPDSQLFRYLV